MRASRHNRRYSNKMRTLYLHGFASGPASKKATFFRRRIPSLEIPDLAAGDFEHLSITSQIDVIDEMTVGESVSLIGSSMGGYLAALYAARRPEAVARLVLLAPALRLHGAGPRPRKLNPGARPVLSTCTTMARSARDGSATI